MDSHIPQKKISSEPDSVPNATNSTSVRRLSAVPLLVVSAIGLLTGAVGGALGATFILKNPNSGVTQSVTSLNQPGNQQVSGSVDNGIVNIVKQDSPAVVSIVESQNISQLPGYGTNGFNNDPFFNFFFNNGSGNNYYSQPNSDGSGSSSDMQEVAAGTGFFISANGLILTNKHVVADTNASYTVITTDGTKYDAKVLSRDPVNDLALVQVSVKNAPYLQLASSSNLQVGQAVIAIGNSLGQYQNTVTNGIISGIGRQITAGGETGSSEDLTNVIQTNAAINPGNSGGPLLNMAGQVIGINTAIDQQGQLVGFALPANEAEKAIVSFQKNGQILRPYLGVRYIMINASIEKQENLKYDYGAWITPGQNQNEPAVVAGSPADAAGLTGNDIILSINGTKLDDQNNTLSAVLENYNPGDTVTLRIYDGKSEQDVKVVLTKSPTGQ